MTDLAERRDVETTVYQPAEDTRLLFDAALDRVGRHHRVLEVGTGSGFIAARLAVETGATVVASDVNPHACRTAREQAVEAGVDVGVVRADLVSPFPADAFDRVVFNPPYLPADPDGARDDWMERALSGGEDGRAVVEPFLDDLARVLRPDGIGVLLVSTLTGIGEVARYADDRGLHARTVAEEAHPYERLAVLALHRE